MSGSIVAHFGFLLLLRINVVLLRVWNFGHGGAEGGDGEKTNGGAWPSWTCCNMFRQMLISHNRRRESKNPAILRTF